MSSGLPWFLVSQDGVEDGEELAGDGDEGDHLGLAGGAEVIAEGLEDGVVTAGDEGCEEQGAAHALAAAADHALALPLAGLAGGGGKACEGGVLLLVEGAERGQLGDEGSGDDRSDAGDGGEEVLLVAPGGRAAHAGVDLGIDLGELLLEGADEAGDALLDAPHRGAALAVPLGDDHLDDLAPAGAEGGAGPRAPAGGGARSGGGWGGRGGRRGRRGAASPRRAGAAHRVSCRGRSGRSWRRRSGRSWPACRPPGRSGGSGPDWRRRAAGRRRQAQPPPRSRSRRSPRRRRDRGERQEPLDQLGEAFAVARDGKGDAVRPDVNVEPILRDVDADSLHVHAPSSLRNRALAAQATVRGRWNDGRGTKLPLRARGPRGTRSPARHRAKHHA